MRTVTSKDGSRIAYDRLGSGPPVIVEAAGGAASLWGWSSGGALALRDAHVEGHQGDELRELEGVSHNVKMNLLTPVLAEFFAA